MPQEFQDFFKEHEVSLNKDFADRNIQEFMRFCNWKHREEQGR